MMQEEDFELAQYPDFMDSIPGFEEEIFETTIGEDEDGGGAGGVALAQRHL